MADSMHIVYLSLGSNMGDRERFLRFAVEKIEEIAGCKVLKESAILKTKAWGKTDQPDFLNMAIKIECSLLPQELLEKLQEIEAAAGRERLIKWGPRTLDIDILLYDDLKISTPTLTIPHPLMQERDFVMIPLNEIKGDF